MMGKVEDVYREIEHIVGSDFITDKDFMKAAYSRNIDPAFPDRWADMIVDPNFLLSPNKFHCIIMNLILQNML